MQVCHSTALSRAFTFFAIACMALSFFSAATLNAGAETIVVSGAVSSQAHVTITDTFTMTGLDPAQLTNASKVTCNVPIYESKSVNGFQQTITGFSVALSRQPDASAQGTDPFGTRYHHYEWSLAGYPQTTLTITITTTFDYSATGNPAPETFSEPFPIGTVSDPDATRFLSPTSMVQSSDPQIVARAQEVTGTAATEAEAVERVMDYIKVSVADLPNPVGKDALSTLAQGRGNCVNRANLACALLRARGVPARLAKGIVCDDPYTVDFVAPQGQATFQTNWGQELHTWVEVYFPDHGWVPYDPFLNKGFVDHRHVMYGVALDGEENNEPTGGVSDAWTISSVNPGASGTSSYNLQVAVMQDTGGYAFRSLKPSPSGYYVIGRDMVNAPTPTLGPTLTPTPTVVPNVTATPVPNATATPTTAPNATVSPTPAPNATATPVPTEIPDSIATPDGSVYFITGIVVDDKTGARLQNATITLDGRPVTLNATGTFAAQATDGAHTLTVSVPGYGTGSYTVTVSGADPPPVVFRMKEPATGDGGGPGWSLPCPCIGSIAVLAGVMIIGIRRYGRA